MKRLSVHYKKVEVKIVCCKCLKEIRRVKWKVEKHRQEPIVSPGLCKQCFKIFMDKINEQKERDEKEN